MKNRFELGRIFAATGVLLLVAALSVVLLSCAGSQKQDTTQADTAQAGTVQADIVQPDTAQADTAQADTAQADTAQKITFLSVNDFHGALAESSSKTGNPGGAKLVGSVKALVAESPASTFVFSTGDNYQGSAVSNLNYGKPVSALFREMEVSLIAVGNHEFDWIKGPGDYYFGDWEKDTDAKYLGANIIDKSTGKIADFVKPYEIISVNGLKIGVIGVVTQETAMIVTARNVAPLQFEDTIVATKRYYDEIKDQCDAVIVLGHIGAEMEGDNITGEAADLANAMPQLAAIFSGHTHTLINGIVNGVPIVQGGSNGRYISRLDLNFDGKRLSGVDHDVVSISGEAEKAAAPADQASLDILAKFNADLAPLMAQVVGYNGTALETKPEVAYWMCELLYDYLMRTEGKPFIVTQNDGGVRSGGIPLPEGDITMNYMYGLMPFDNAIVVMEMSGTDLIALLERPESELVSKLDFYGAQKFDDEWLLLADNEPITADGVYNVMCNDFMHTGGDNFDFSKGTNVRYLGTPLRDAMVEETEFRIGGATTSFNSARTPRRVLLAALIGG